jgi:ligand-binding sensor domain-containing protein
MALKPEMFYMHFWLNNKYVKILTIVLLLHFSCIVSFSQNTRLNFERITTERIRLEKGLSQNTVFSILQDSKGYLWFGTWDGLNRYDGIRFKIYRPDFFNFEESLSDQTINALCEDNEGYIWIGTNLGLNRFNRKNETFNQYYFNPENDFALSNDTINTLFVDSKGNLWIGTQNGLNRFDTETERFYVFKNIPGDKNSLSNNVIQDIYEDFEHNLWIATNKGLNKINRNNKTFECFCSSNCENCISNNTIRSITGDKKGNLYVGTDGGLNVVNIKTNKIKSFQHDETNPSSISHNSVSCIFVNDDMKIWIGTLGGGLNIFDPDNEMFIHYKYNSGNHASISNDFIYSIVKDYTHSIWIGTAWNGVNKVDENLKIFTHYVKRSGVGSLNSNNIWSFAEDREGKIWIASQNGINILNRKTNRFSYLKHIPGNANSMLDNNTQYIFIDSKDNVWFGYVNSGLSMYNPETKEFTHYKYERNDTSSLQSNSINCITEDKKGFIWVGVNNGLHRINPYNSEINTFQNNPEDNESLSNNMVYVVYEDNDGELWAGTYNGLNLLNRKTGKFEIFKHEPNNKNSLTLNKIFSIYQDKKNGYLWVGTMGGGLNRYDKKTKEFKHYTERENLPNNVVYATLEDKLGNLWVSTNFGLAQFNTEEERFVVYDVQDGLQSYEFNLGAAYTLKTGEMLFGGLNGFNIFHPEEIKRNQQTPEIVISSYKVLNEYQNNELNNGDTLKLPFNENFISFEFAALDYTNPEKNQYKYILERFDKEWNFADASRAIAEYTKVSPGTYKLKIIGSNNDGVWNEEGFNLTIIITPPWYRTWVFRIGVIFFIVLLTYVLISRRIKSIRQKHTIEKEMYELERQALRLQMNPHFIFNTLNSIQSFVVTKDTKKAIDFLSKFARLMRAILTNSREAFVSLKDELQALSYYLDIERLRFDNKFEYTINCDKEIDDDFVAIPPMFIQPYVENAILHGIMHKKDDGKITIDISEGKDGSTLIISIEDDGVGREYAMKKKQESGIQHKSRGMLITKERLAILNEQHKENVSVKIVDLKDQEGKAIGTKVIISTIYKEL